jgi:uncharacterized protein (DUF488 family)
MPTLYTIGYEKKPLSVFIHQLRDTGVDAIIDVRLRNTSHLAGYTKKDDLAFLLAEGFGIAYDHHPELAPSDEILDAYKAKGGGDWSRYQEQFLPLLAARGAETVGEAILARYRAPCLLCKEADAAHCHRRLVAEFWRDRISDLTIVHL